MSNKADISINFAKAEKLGYIVIKENILKSQRVERFAIDIGENGKFSEIYSGTTIGYKRIVPMNGMKTDCVRIRITDSRIAPVLSFIGVYRMAPGTE